MPSAVWAAVQSWAWKSAPATPTDFRQYRQPQLDLSGSAMPEIPGLAVRVARSTVPPGKQLTNLAVELDELCVQVLRRTRECL